MPGKTALVLCGGGSRGATEIGFYRAIVELGIPIDFILGASVGAVNGAFIAGGLSPEETKRLWLDFQKWNPFRFNWKTLWRLHKAESLLDPKGLGRFLEDSLPVKTFEDLKIPLTVVATNLQKAEPVYFEGKGDLTQIPHLRRLCIGKSPEQKSGQVGKAFSPSPSQILAITHKYLSPRKIPAL